MNCQNCNSLIASKFARRFCCKSCAAQYNNKNRNPRSTESREKTSKSIKALGTTKGFRSQTSRQKASESYSQSRLEYLFNTSFNNLHHQSKRVRLILEQNGKCAHCGLSEWMGNPISFEMDHIDGNKRNNTRENLEILCPNCHSMTPTWRGRKVKSNDEEIKNYSDKRRQKINEYLKLINVGRE